MTREEARLLPVIQWDGREFLVDVDARQFRNVNDAGEFIDMHSPQGRTMVKQMQMNQVTLEEYRCRKCD